MQRDAVLADCGFREAITNGSKVKRQPKMNLVRSAI